MSDPRGMLDFLMASLVTMTNSPDYPKVYFPSFLPTVDHGKYTPFKTAFDLGAVETVEKSASDNICLAGWAVSENYDGGIATGPPVIKLTSITLNGLQNLKITSYAVGAQNATQQYPVTFTAELNAYPTLPNLGIDPGEFYFECHCCSSDDQETCNGKHSATLTANGTFKAEFNEPLFQAAMLVTLGSDLQVSVEIPAPDPPHPPSLYLSSPEKLAIHIHDIQFPAPTQYKKDWESLANEAFASPDASSMILKAFNDTFNTEDNRTTLAEAIGQQMTDLVAKLK